MNTESDLSIDGERALREKWRWKSKVGPFKIVTEKSNQSYVDVLIRVWNGGEASVAFQRNLEWESEIVENKNILQAIKGGEKQMEPSAKIN